jgi:uncharacterized protein YbjT (DUF2867 family)
MKDGIVTVFGGGGFVGRYLVQDLLAGGEGYRVRVAQRRPKAAWFLRPLGSLGQTQFLAADVRNKATVKRAVEGASAVVNLVGVLKGDFWGFHVEGARNVAEACAAARVRTLVHLSAIGADPESPSRYGRSKGLGEEEVRKAFPAATIVRPSIVFGREDGFTNRFAGMLGLPVVPVVRNGVKFQPVFVADLAQAIARAVADPAAHVGKTYEIGGPEQVSMRDLLGRLADWTGQRPQFVELPDMAAGAIARLGGWAPGAPITWDQWLMLQRDNVVADGASGLDAFGIAPTPMAAVAPSWLVRFRKQGRFGGVKTVES